MRSVPILGWVFTVDTWSTSDAATVVEPTIIGRLGSRTIPVSDLTVIVVFAEELIDVLISPTTAGLSTGGVDTLRKSASATVVDPTTRGSFVWNT